MMSQENIEAAIKSGFNFSDFYTVPLTSETQETTEAVLDESKKLKVKQVLVPIAGSKAEEAANEFIVNCVKAHGAKPKLKKSGVVEQVQQSLMSLFGWTEIYKVNCFILNNKDLLAPMIEEAANDFFKAQKQKALATLKDKTVAGWNIPNIEPYNKNTYSKREYKKYAFSECWLKKGSSVEEGFQSYLDNNDNVVWWWKNKNHGGECFAIKYMKNNERDRFLPDYIVMFKSGIVGIFDTKGGQTAEAKEKAEALYNYVLSQNTNKISIIGGIVIEHNGYKINTNKTYSYDETNLGKDWVNLNEYLKDML